ncbi:MAG: hypothetical protein COV71_00605 [Candidatus Omnitrophica bacterium CG11_big_fil_rev_8_21_14_0_20_41_12]|nr:MAG: hypothetical protein COV71_00605 [Candidatus Omnitrophica bacterium CG11_big_fil_rev_8_21_14_0_20_41_12]
MKNALRIILFVFVMGTVSSAMLVGLNLYTTPLIERNEELKLKASVLDVFEIPYGESEIVNVFNKDIEVIQKDKDKFYKTTAGAVAFEISGPGLWGQISGIISLERDLKTIRKIKITHQEETPGLGSRIAEATFLQQFRNKEVLPKIIFMPEGKASGKNEVDAITGATGSSRAFEKLINANLEKYLAILKG